MPSLVPLHHWILDEDHRLQLVDLDTWARWFCTIEDRRVALTVVAPGIEVSTVFLGIDHGWGGGPPLLFETMTFGGDGRELADGGFDRYSTWEEAEDGHARIVAELRKRFVHQ